MSSARNLASTYKMSDGTPAAPMESSRPKSARQSVCQRSTAASDAMRQKVTEKSKQGTAFKVGGEKLATDRTIEGSAPKKYTKERSAQEKSNDSALLASSAASTAGRAQARGKAAVCESNGVLFDKSKRQSFMPESTKLRKDMSSCSKATEEGDSCRKINTARDHASNVFSMSGAPEHRPARVCNIQQEAPTLPVTVKSAATEKAYQAMNAASDMAQSQRINNRRQNNASTIFSNGENLDVNHSRPSTASSKTASNIFRGGAFADDAAKCGGRGISRPALNVSAPTVSAGGGGDLPSARAHAQAALRGNGGLW